MKAIICAAGEGKRLRPYTDDCPKALLNIGNKTIIEQILDNLSEVGVKDATIVVGYKKESVINKIGNKYKKCHISYVINENYSNTDNMYSLWLGMKNVDDGIIFFNADVVFDVRILKDILDERYENAAVVSKNIKLDSMKVIIENNLVRKFGKEIKEEVQGDAIGIYKLSKGTTKKYFEIASRLISEGHINVSFVSPLNLMANEVQIKPVYTENYVAFEIDNIDDYEYAIKGTNELLQNYYTK